MTLVILDRKKLLYRQKIAQLLATRKPNGPNGFNFKYESLHCFEIYVDSLRSNQGTCLVLAFATCMHPVYESAIIRVWKSIDGFAIKLVLSGKLCFNIMHKCLITTFISKLRNTFREITEIHESAKIRWIFNKNCLMSSYSDESLAS